MMYNIEIVGLENCLWCPLM